MPLPKHSNLNLGGHSYSDHRSGMWVVQRPAGPAFICFSYLEEAFWTLKFSKNRGESQVLKRKQV